MICDAQGMHVLAHVVHTCQPESPECKTVCCSSIVQQNRSAKDPDARGQPVSRVHVDYTVKSGPARLHAALPDEAQELSRTPFAVIQVSIRMLCFQSECICQTL